MPEPLPRERGKEPFDGNHPRGQVRNEVRRPIGAVIQPCVDFGRFGVGDEVEGGGEFLRAATLDHLAADLSGGAVALAVVGEDPGMAGLHRQDRLRPSLSLDRCHPIRREDDSVVGRVDAGANEIADIQLEARVAGVPIGS